MLRTSNSRILIVAFLCIFSLSINAQKPGLAHAGPNGVFLTLGKKVPSGKLIDAYKIERKVNGVWKQVAEVRTPASLTEMVAKAEDARKILPYQPFPPRQKMQQIFDKARESGTLDSLKNTPLQYSLKIGLGLMYHDETAPKGVVLQYRVTELSSNGNSQDQQLSDTLSLPFIPHFDEITMVESSRNPRSIYIKWRSTGKNPGPLFMVRRVEKDKAILASGSLGHYSVNDTTYYIYQDSLTESQANQELRYNITPYDQFGNTGKSSQVVAITIDNFTKAEFLWFQASKVKDDLGIRIAWHFSDQVTIKSMDIYRSEYQEKGFSRVASITGKDTVYIDKTIVPEKSYYYYLNAVSKSGKRFKQSNRVFVLAYQPAKPAAPVINEAKGNEKGVSLLITPGSSDYDKIRVFRNNGVTDQMISIAEITRKTDSTHFVFIDSTAGISGRHTYTYAVRSERINGLPSDLSNRMNARPLMSDAPPSPAFLRLTPDKETITLIWENMMAQDGSIAGYIISRRTETGKADASLPFSPIMGEHVPYQLYFMADSSVTAGNVYTYAVQSIDTSKLKSDTRVIATVSLKGRQPVPPCGLKIKNLPEGVKIDWGQTVYEGIKSYRIYCYMTGRKPELKGEIASYATQYLDAKAGNGLYHYYLTTVNQEGQESSPSEEVTVSR